MTDRELLMLAAKAALEALESNSITPDDWGRVRKMLSAALAQPEPKPLRRGTTGRCSRSICICGRDGLGDQCIWLRPSEPMIDGYPLMSGLPPPAQPEPVAWRTFDGEGGYEYRTYDENEDYLDDWNKRNPNHKGWVEPLFL